MIGERLSHSFSPIIHSKIGSYKYDLKEIEQSEIIDFFIQRDFKGINVTIPYKQTVMPLIDYIDEPAKKIGAVNTVVNRGGRLYGYNTDYYGLKNLLTRSFREFNGKSALILGTGGTSNTAFAVLRDLGVTEIFKVSRSPKQGEIDYSAAENEKNYADIIINTTPCGMFPNSDICPISTDNFDNLKLVVDAIYNPLNSKLILNAKNRGIKAFGGLFMLVSQAVCASEYFFDKKYDMGLCENIFKDILWQKQNIALIGMPAAGKTTIGRVLEEYTSKKLIDTDQLIVKKAKMPITEIFATVGEEGFRRLEAEVIKEVSLLNDCIISTGGGAVLKQENIENLRQNSIICFIDRDLSELVPTADRPTADSRESIINRYNERIEIYRSSCDFSVEVTNPQATAKNIIQTAKGLLKGC